MNKIIRVAPCIIRTVSIDVFPSEESAKSHYGSYFIKWPAYQSAFEYMAIEEAEEFCEKDN